MDKLDHMLNRKQQKISDLETDVSRARFKLDKAESEVMKQFAQIIKLEHKLEDATKGLRDPEEVSAYAQLQKENAQLKEQLEKDGDLYRHKLIYDCKTQK